MRVTPVSLPFAACLLSQNKDELQLENTITEDLLRINKSQIFITYREQQESFAKVSEYPLEDEYCPPSRTQSLEFLEYCVFVYLCICI